MRLKPYLWTILLLLCAGCSGGGAVVFAPTPLPPDLSPLRYEHTGGAFTIDVPRDWAVYTQNATNLATVSFSPPENDGFIASVQVIRLDETLDVGEVVNQYQQGIRPDIRRYLEQDRQAMGNGNWRISGIRQTLGGDFETINTFIQQDGAFIGIIEVVLPTNDPTLFAELETLANTLHINQESDLSATSLETLSASAYADIEIINVWRWFTDSGVLFITGEVINRTTETLSDIPIRVGLYAEDGTGIAEALDTVMGHGLPPGGFAPFSLRFGQGQPPEATSYLLTLDAGARMQDTLYGQESLIWTDDSVIDDEGRLIIEGTVINTSDESIDDLLAIVTVFDETRQVISARFEPLGDEPLDPEEARDYRILVTEMGDAPDNYIVTIQGR